MREGRACSGRSSSARTARRVSGIAAAAVACLTGPATRAAQTSAAWVNPAGGSWFDSANWSVAPLYPHNGAPTASDTYAVTIGLTGVAAYTVNVPAAVGAPAPITVDQLTLSSAPATVVLSGGTLSAADLAVNAGTFKVAGGTLKGTTIGGSGGGVLMTTGTLDAGAMARDVQVQNAGGGDGSTNFRVRNGLLVSSAAATFRSVGAGLTFEGTQTLAGPGTTWVDAMLVKGGGANVLTIADGALVKAGTSVSLQGAGLVNRGTLRSAGTLLIDNPAAGNDFQNVGVLEAPAGTTLTVTAAFANSGTVRASGGGVVTLGGAWSNAGTLAVSDGTLSLNGTFTRASVGAFQRAGGVVNFGGTLDNAGGTLELNDTTGTWTVQGGALIVGGTVRTAGAASFYLSSSSNLTLRGVTLDSSLALNGGQLKVDQGLALSGRQVFGNGKVTLNAGSAAQSIRDGTLAFYDSTANRLEGLGSRRATLATDLLVQAEYLTIAGGTGGVYNDGVIRSLAPLGQLVLSGNVVNQGVIDIQSGGTLRSDVSPATRMLTNLAVVNFTGPRASVAGGIDNGPSALIHVLPGADATFTGPVSGSAGATVRVDAGATARFRAAVTGDVTFTGDGEVTMESGASVVNALSGGPVTVASLATISAATVAAGTLVVDGELAVRPATPGAAVAASRVNRLEIDEEGVVALGGNSGLIVDYATGSTSGFAGVRANVRGGQLTGGNITAVAAPPAGATPAAAAAPPSASQLGVGYAEAAAVLGPNGGVFMGQRVDGSAVLVRYTLLGDANLDGAVDFNDLVRLAQNYNQPAGGLWANGDFNDDGAVDFNDLVKLAQNYNQSYDGAGAIPGATPEFGADFAAALSAVPEPGVGFAAAGSGAVAGLLRRRRRRGRFGPPPDNLPGGAVVGSAGVRGDKEGGRPCVK